MISSTGRIIDGMDVMWDMDASATSGFASRAALTTF